MTMRSGGLIVLGLLLSAGRATGALSLLADVMKQTPNQIVPAVYFVLARKLFKTGRKDAPAESKLPYIFGPRPSRRA
jgi:hypothetical protein